MVKTVNKKTPNVIAEEVENSALTAEPEKIVALPLPYPDFEAPAKGEYNLRTTLKVMANTLTQLLNDNPDHPKRKEIEQTIKEKRAIADMDDKSFRSHELYEANPIHKLTSDEKLHCIRSLPVPIVKKLFPHI